MYELCRNCEVKRASKYAVDVTLGPDTANIYLVLSDNGISPGTVKQNVPDTQRDFLLLSLRKAARVSLRFRAGRLDLSPKTEQEVGSE